MEECEAGEDGGETTVRTRVGELDVGDVSVGARVGWGTPNEEHGWWDSSGVKDMCGDTSGGTRTGDRSGGREWMPRAGRELPLLPTPRSPAPPYRWHGSRLRLPPPPTPSLRRHPEAPSPPGGPGSVPPLRAGAALRPGAAWPRRGGPGSSPRAGRSGAARSGAARSGGMGVAGPWVLRVGLGLGAFALLLQGLRGWLACKRYEFQPAEIAELARHHAGMWGWGETGSGTEKGKRVRKGAAVGEWGREVLVLGGSGMGRASAPMGSPVGSQQGAARYWDRAAVTSESRCS